MEVSPAEIIDRMSIVRLKIERIGNPELNLEMTALKQALEEFREGEIHIEDGWLDELYDINSKEWDLLDKMNEEKNKGNYEEVGKLYLETEMLNKKRSNVKNKIVEKTEKGFREIKKGHISDMDNKELEEENKKVLQEECVKVSLETARGGIKESCVLPEHLSQYEVDISPETKAVLITPDMGKVSNKDEIIIPNLHNGLFRIHAFLHEKNISSVTLDTSLDNVKRAWELIGRHKPPFIAFSPYYDSIRNDLNNVVKVLELSPNSIIVAGGFEASLNPQWETLGGLIDILVKGEGEWALTELIQRHQKFFQDNPYADKLKFLEYLKKDFEIHPIPGVSILSADGTIQTSPVKKRIDPNLYQEINLNAFQKYLSLSPIEKYWKINRWLFGGKKDAYFRFVSSDHCPYKCVFCQSSVYYSKIMGKKFSPVRYINPENILKIIKAVSDQLPFINGMYIDDENFIINRERAIEALNLIIDGRETGEIRKDIVFQCRTRTDNIDSEICRLLKQAGFETVSVGSESYSSKELEYLNKNTSPEQNLKAIKIILDSGLNVAENYILFTPATTADTFYDNALRICQNIGELGVDGTATLFLTPLPGTKLWGDGNYEIVRDFPYKQELFKNKVMFYNPKTGYDYIGEEIKVPGTNSILPHPEIMLVNNPLMRKVSLEFLQHLPKTINYFRELAGGEHSLSREFITLANLSAASEILYGLTKEQRWKDLNNRIEEIVRKKS